MGMTSIPIETYSMRKWQLVVSWLTENFGEPSKETWWIDVQPMMEDLVCTEEIATLFLLKWN